MCFWLSYSTRDAIPARLQHHFSATAQPAGDQGPTIDYDAEDFGSARVSENDAVVIWPPLAGKGWFDANGAGPVIYAHRYGLLPVNGALRPQEIFAIDFIKMNDQGLCYQGHNTKVENYFGYGQPIISSTDGVVVEAVDGRPDEVPPAQPTILEYALLPGNHVYVAIGDGRFAEYLHLAPGSVAVKVGEKVHVGQLLGKLALSSISWTVPNSSIYQSHSVRPWLNSCWLVARIPEGMPLIAWLEDQVASIAENNLST
jgi:hypothetical protein